MRRGLWMLLAALLVAVAIGDTIVWRVTEQRLRTGLAEWIAAARAAGWTVSASTPQAGGWPLAATLTVRDVALQGGESDIPGGLTWRAEQVVLRITALRPHELQIEAQGAQHLRLAAAPDIPYTAAGLRLVVPLQADPLAQPLDLHGETLQAAIPGDAVTLDRLDAHAVLNPAAAKGQAAVSLSATAGGIGLPPRQKWPLGARIASISLNATLNGPLSGVAGLTARATAWRDGGGAVEVRHFEMLWGPLGLAGTAQLALDPDLQPTGTGMARVTGYTATLDALVRSGVISRSAATSAKALLFLLTTAPDDGGPSVVAVPLSLQHRVLAMHEVPLVRLPKLDWPPP
jgi:hypothetical protein